MSPIVTEPELPMASALDQSWVQRAHFRDCRRIPLTRVNSDPVHVFFALFGHHPLWMKVVLILRHKLVALFGLAVPKSSEVMHFERRERYSIGDRIGVWSIFGLNDTELIVGRDNKHLDFRLSIFMERTHGIESAVVSTVCVVRNWFGKTYLFFVVPFHRVGVKVLFARAQRARRL